MFLFKMQKFVTKRAITSLKTRSLLYLFLCFLLMSGCNDCSYEVDSLTRVRVRFVDEAGKEKKVNFSTVEAVSDEKRPALYVNQTLSIYELPLNTLTNEGKFVFKTAGIPDTVTIEYSVRYEPVTPNCGVKEIVILKSVSTTGRSLKNATLVRTQPLVYYKYDVDIQN
ncbi:MAG: hypothetical protein EAZ57_10745 [Cytophagales bacterium]|nr:MAG: hypothetical protein EAZ67_11350 [Cytophagales bacterium]TAF59552.1 MAG: hypothetical protein EAZ57_10745 [Cytophagales bacterium]